MSVPAADLNAGAPAAPVASARAPGDIAVAQPARVGALQAQPAGLRLAARVRRHDGRGHVRRAVQQRPAARRPLQRRVVLPGLQQPAGGPLRRRLRHGDGMGRPVHPRAVREARQFRAVHVQHLGRRRPRLLCAGGRPVPAQPRPLARHRPVGPRHDGAAALRLPRQHLLQPRADLRRDSAGHPRRRAAGLLRRARRPDHAAGHRDLERDPGALPPHHHRVDPDAFDAAAASAYSRCSAGSRCPTTCAPSSCATATSSS